ncbi:MAG: ATP-binding protein [Dehalococcoidia bacterium]|nr:ATP-binding protein [Dehalococcoidia bacterium]
MNRFHNTRSTHEGQAATAASRDARRLLRSLDGLLPEPMLQTVLVVVSGLPGTGKSYFSQRLAQQAPLTVLESDAMRKVLTPSPIHTAKESARLFQAIHEVIDLLLGQRLSVLLDATSLAEAHREPLYRLAERHNAKMMLVLVEAPPQVVRQRLDVRGKTPLRQDHSDADWGVYQRMRPLQEPIKRDHISVDTSGDIEPVVAKVAREIQRWTRQGR